MTASPAESRLDQEAMLAGKEAAEKAAAEAKVSAETAAVQAKAAEAKVSAETAVAQAKEATERVFAEASALALRKIAESLYADKDTQKEERDKQTADATERRSYLIEVYKLYHGHINTMFNTSSFSPD